jgi:hypothetical protein
VGRESLSVLVGTAGLSVAALISVWLTLSRGPAHVGSARLRAVVGFAVGALLCQSVHFVEELLTGFPERFPALFGLAPWSSTFFVSFNIFWIVLWGFSCLAVTRGFRIAPGPLWFLAIASLANGIAHPLLSVRVGGYFPGLFTSPLVGLMGILLLRQMVLVTGTYQQRTGAA